MERPVINFIFDAYGTIVHNPSKTNLYKELVSKFQIPSPMVTNIQFEALVKNLKLSKLEQDNYIDLMNDELSNIYIDQEAYFLISDLKDRGYFISVASNLANPYSAPLQKFYGNIIDSFIFSYEIGFKKPDLEFYKIVMNEANIKQNTNFSAHEFLMIGDSYKNDCLGPLHCGISSLHQVDEYRKVNWESIRSHLGIYL